MLRAENAWSIALSLAAFVWLASVDAAPLLQGAAEFRVPCGAYAAVLPVLALLFVVLPLHAALQSESRECARLRLALACQRTRTAREFVALLAVCTLLAWLYFFAALVSLHTVAEPARRVVRALDAHAVLVHMVPLLVALYFASNVPFYGSWHYAGARAAAAAE